MLNGRLILRYPMAVAAASIALLVLLSPAGAGASDYLPKYERPVAIYETYTYDYPFTPLVKVKVIQEPVAVVPASFPVPSPGRQSMTALPDAVATATAATASYSPSPYYGHPTGVGVMIRRVNLARRR